jgi:hypothetical protein
MAKLTLDMGPEVIVEARRLAAERGTNVSALFARFIKALASDRDQTQPLGMLTRRASGVIDLGGRDHKDVLAEAIQETHGL